MNRFEEVKAIVDRVAFPGYRFELAPLGTDQAPIAMRVIYDEPDVMSGVVEHQQVCVGDGAVGGDTKLPTEIE